MIIVAEQRGEKMDDLISRQAAIDAAIEATDSWEGVCSIGRQKRIENYINSLPFAPGMDLISRQAAIDMIRNHWSDFSNADNYRTAKACVDAVPSAQPDIVRCKDCKWRMSENRKTTSLWLPCRAIVTPDKFSCIYAERREVTE